MCLWDAAGGFWLCSILQGRFHFQVDTTENVHVKVTMVALSSIFGDAISHGTLIEDGAPGVTPRVLLCSSRSTVLPPPHFHLFIFFSDPDCGLFVRLALGSTPSTRSQIPLSDRYRLYRVFLLSMMSLEIAMRGGCTSVFT